MKALILVTLVAFSFATQAQVLVGTQEELVSKKGGKKSEPAPKDRDERKGGEESPHPRQETYEGNDRGNGGGGSFDGSGSGEGSGFDSEIFKVRGGKKYAPKTNVLKTEDRGTVIVYTSVEQEDVSASETCTTITTTVVDKATETVLSEEVEEYCNNWPL